MKSDLPFLFFEAAILLEHEENAAIPAKIEEYKITCTQE